MPELLYKVYSFLRGNQYIRSIRIFFHALYNGIDKDDCVGQATKISYTTLFSLIPLLIVTIMILTILGLDSEHINDLLHVGIEALPPEIQQLIEEFVRRILTTPPQGLFSVSIIIILWSSTTVFSEIIYGLNRIANTTEIRSFLKRRLIAFVLVMGAGLSSGIALLLLMIGMKTMRFFGIPNITFFAIFKYKWLVSIFFLLLAAVLLYSVAPSTRPRLLYTFPGALFFASFVILLTKLVQKGVIKFVFSNALYGTLGSGLLLMTWFFMVSLILLVGAEINAILERWDDILISRTKGIAGKYNVEIVK